MTDFVVNDLNDNSVSVRNIYCVGRNYAAHAKELSNAIPDEPFFFQKALPSLNVNSSIELPKNREIHHELEIVILIGRDGVKVSKSEAWEYIIGLTLGLDLTDRLFQSILKKKRLPWLLSKSFQGSAVVATFSNPDRVEWSREFWLKINGILVQKGSMKNMLFQISELIEYLSAHVPLLRGDLMFTGTPEGVGVIKPGDHCQLGLGNKLIAEYDVS